MLPRTTEIRTKTNLKTKEQPELPENQTVWKSDNQGVKEETFIQIGRRDRERQLGQREHGARQWTNASEVATGRPGQARLQLADWAVSHLGEDKLGETTEEQDKPRNPEL